MIIEGKKVKFFALLCLSIILIVSLMPSAYSAGFDSLEIKTLFQPQGEQKYVHKCYKYHTSPWSMG